MLSARHSRRQRHGARRGPRLARGAQKTLQLRCFIEGVYQGTTYPKRSGLRADLTAPRPRAARAVQIDFRRGAVKRLKRGAFSRRASREHVAVPRSLFELALRSRRPTARGAVRGSHRAPRKPFAWGAFSRTYTNTQPINFICILSGFDGHRGAKTTPRCISPGRFRPHASNGVEVVPLHVYSRNQCLDRISIDAYYETVFGPSSPTSKTHTKDHRRLQ